MGLVGIAGVHGDGTTRVHDGLLDAPLAVAAAVADTACALLLAESSSAVLEPDLCVCIDGYIMQGGIWRQRERLMV